jgi:hypothetical protein
VKLALTRGVVEAIVRGLCLVVPVGVTILVLLGSWSDAGDPVHYQRLAERILGGQAPYRDFAVEYPPLALLPMLLPHLLSDVTVMSPEQYRLLFLAEALVLSVVAAALVALLAVRGWSAQSTRMTAFTYAALALSISPVLLWRYDILPAFLATLAFVAIAVGRPGMAGVALGLGAVAKIYPAFLVPIAVGFYLVQRDARAAIALIVGFVVSAAAVLAPFLVLAGPAVFSFVDYQGARGVEIGSVLSGFVLLLHVVAGVPANTYFDFESWQVASPLLDAVAWPRRIFELTLVGGLMAGGAISFFSERRASGAIAPRTLARYLLAGLLLLVLTNKVLSPQYLVWLLPLAALMSRPQATVLLVAGGLTTIIYPLNFAALINLDPVMIAVLNARNLLLLVLFVWLARPLAGDASPDAEPASHEDPPLNARRIMRRCPDGS